METLSASCSIYSTYPDYNRLIGGIGGLIGVIVLLPVALYYLRKG